MSCLMTVREVFVEQCAMVMTMPFGDRWLMVKCANRMLPRILLAAELTSGLSQTAVIDSKAAKTTTVLNLLIPLLVGSLPYDFPIAITWAGEQGCTKSVAVIMYIVCRWPCSGASWQS